MLGYSATNIKPLDRRCDRTGPLLHGMSPLLISEVAIVANVENTRTFPLELDCDEKCCQEYLHLFPNPSPVSEDTAEIIFFEDTG